MPIPVTPFDSTVWELPPLILYPFNEHLPPASLLESSKAALMLSGLIPSDGTEREVLQRRLLAGRYAEIRMLFFLGKDVLRWVEQCHEMVERTPELQGAEIHGQSFANLLIGSPPPAVLSKLLAWGVADYAALFSRGIGLKSAFVVPPPLDLLTAEFVTGYHRNADALFRSYMESQTHRTITHQNFHFDLYASGEYTRMLENQWEEPQQSGD
ncbi:MAG TPA: hypothetical protein VG096_16385 [Bryobacteraceae bacterium]|jgi:hypothetical protein|nr:hypothetical protein [Bryobacteraceae bacterium]